MQGSNMSQSQESENRNSQNPFFNNNGSSNHQRGQQSPSGNQQNVQMLPHRTNRIFTPYESTIKSRHQRIPSGGGLVKGVAFHQNKRPGDMHQMSGESHEQLRVHEDGSSIVHDQQAASMRRQNLQGTFTIMESQSHSLLPGHDSNESTNQPQGYGNSYHGASKIHRQYQQHDSNQNSQEFSPRENPLQKSSKQRNMQPHLKKRTPSGVPPGGTNQLGNRQQLAQVPQNIDMERRKVERVRTQGIDLSLSPNGGRDRRIEFYRGEDHDSNNEDSVPENGNADAQMMGQHQSDDYGGDGTAYPRMFSNKRKQKQQQSSNFHGGNGRPKNYSHQRDYASDEEEDGNGENTAGQVFNQEEDRNDIQLPYSQGSSPTLQAEAGQRHTMKVPRAAKQSSNSSKRQYERNQGKASVGRKATGTQHNQSNKHQRELQLNLQGVQQEKVSNVRKILSMRNPYTLNRDDEENSENVLDHPQSSEDVEAKDRLYNKQDEQDRINQVRQERAVHSPSNKFSSIRTNNQQDNIRQQHIDNNSRSKYLIKNQIKNSNKSKSNTAKVTHIQRGQPTSPVMDKGIKHSYQNNQNQNDLDNKFFENQVKANNIKHKKASERLENQGATPGSQSARGPQTALRGLSQSRVQMGFNNQNNTSIGWQPANPSASRKTFNQTQRISQQLQAYAGSKPNQRGKYHHYIQHDENNSDNAEYNFIDQFDQEGEGGESTSPSKMQSQGLMEMPKTNQLMGQRDRISNLSSHAAAQHYQPTGQGDVLSPITPSTMMPQQMRVSPSKRKSQHNQHPMAGGSTSGVQVYDQSMRRKGRGQQEQGNPKQISDKYNIYTNPIQNVQASQVYMPESMEHLEQDEDLGQEFTTPYSSIPNQQQKPRKSSVRLSFDQEEDQQIKNQNINQATVIMNNMIASASQDFSSKPQNYNRLPSRSVQLSFARNLNFKGKRQESHLKVQKMPYSVFERFHYKQDPHKQSTNQDQKSNQGDGTQDSNPTTRTAATLDRPTISMSENRVEKLYDEIYSEESGAFFGFFTNTDKGSKKVGPRLDTYGTNESQSKHNQRSSPRDNADSEFISKSVSTFNTLKDPQFHREQHEQEKLKKQKTKKQNQKDQKEIDPLVALWQELSDQDDELIYSERCQLITEHTHSSASQKAAYSTIYPSGIDTSRGTSIAQQLQLDSSAKYRDATLPAPKPKLVHYDFYPDVHQQAHEIQSIMQNNDVIAHYLVCQQKRICLQEFMRAKARSNNAVDENNRYFLKNSIIPAIQGHILVILNVPQQDKDMLLETVLGCENVNSSYQAACKYVQNWLLSVDFGPLQQGPEADPLTQEPEDELGACLSASVSTKEFYDLKLYQVDEELADSINPMFNPMNTMYYVDRMGNFLLSIKHAFHERVEDKSYLSKMFSSDNNATARENLCKSYDVMREIYESILLPKRQQQLKFDQQLYKQDVKNLKDISAKIKDGFSVDDLSNGSYFNMDMHQDKSPTGLTFFDLHAHEILDISFFNMTTHQYAKALQGLPEYDKNLGENTQVLLKPKIDMLKKRLLKSKNEHEFELVYYIRFLKSQKYNCNIFGRFNLIES